MTRRPRHRAARRRARPARRDARRRAQLRAGNVSLQYSDPAGPAALRAIARTEAGTDTPDASLVAAGQAVIVGRVASGSGVAARAYHRTLHAPQRRATRRSRTSSAPTSGRGRSEDRAVPDERRRRRHRRQRAAIREGIAAAREGGAQLVLFPELAITGYPPEDLLLKEHFLADARAAVERLAAEARGHRRGRRLPRARRRRLQRRRRAAPTASCRAIYRKVRLPNYGVFDEMRYFQSGPGAGARSRSTASRSA